MLASVDAMAGVSKEVRYDLSATRTSVHIDLSRSPLEWRNDYVLVLLCQFETTGSTASYVKAVSDAETLFKKWDPLIFALRSSQKTTASAAVTASSDTTVTEEQVISPSRFRAYQQLAEIAALESNWDTYGASAPSPVAVEAARHLLSILGEPGYYLATNDRGPFAIAPVAGGGVQLEWRVPGHALEVEIEPDGGVGYLVVDESRGERTYEELDGVTLADAVRKVRELTQPVIAG